MANGYDLNQHVCGTISIKIKGFGSQIIDTEGKFETLVGLVNTVYILLSNNPCEFTAKDWKVLVVDQEKGLLEVERANSQ